MRSKRKIAFPPDAGPIKGSRRWRGKVNASRQALQEASDRSPVFRVENFAAGEESFHALGTFLIPTLVKPDGDEIRLDGPCLVAIRYHERWMTEPPVPWELVTVFHPLDIFHPNAGSANGLCIGITPAGIGMQAIVELTYAALTLNSYNTLEWDGLNRDAAAFVRRHADRFPITPTGLYEALPEGVWPHLDLTTRPPLPLPPGLIGFEGGES